MGGYKEEYMEQAFQEAELAKEEEEVPIGCVFVKEGKVVARGRNRTNIEFNGCAHAEVVAMEALRRASPDTAQTILEGSDLYVTVEPCVMCTPALIYNKVKTAYYGCSNDRFGGCGGVLDINKENPYYTLATSEGHQRDRAVALLRSFYETENTNCPEAKRRKKLQP